MLHPHAPSKALTALLGLLVVLLAAVACAKGPDDGLQYATISKDANNKKISAEIANSFVDVPPGTIALGYTGAGSRVTPAPIATMLNIHTVVMDSFKMMNSEVTIQMYVDFLNSPVPHTGAAVSTTNARGINYDTAMAIDVFAGIFRTNESGGLVVSQVDNIGSSTAAGGRARTVEELGVEELTKSEFDPYTLHQHELLGKGSGAGRQPATADGEDGTGAGKIVYNASPGRGNFPVPFVSKAMCITFANWLGPQYRLPTEDEWEYAAKGGIVGGNFPTETGIIPAASTLVDFENNFHDFANYQGNYAAPSYPSLTTRAKAYPPNQFGLYDMAGNLYEWTTLAAGEAATVRSFLKGGSWASRTVGNLTVWHRKGAGATALGVLAGVSTGDLGFRLMFFRPNFQIVRSL